MPVAVHVRGRVEAAQEPAGAVAALAETACSPPREPEGAPRIRGRGPSASHGSTGQQLAEGWWRDWAAAAPSRATVADKLAPAALDTPRGLAQQEEALMSAKQASERRPSSPRPRLDSKLESEGAEFLVLGLLLVEGVPAHKAYTRYPGYDLLAVNPDSGRTCRIQVKSRWATDWDHGFLIKNFESDFVVVAALNRGYRYRRSRHPNDDGRRPPVYYVIPTEVARAALRDKGWASKVRLRDIPDHEQYLDAWQQIRDHLEMR